MQKLSIVMSSVMDKRSTRLKPVDRKKIVETIKTQFIGGDDVLIDPPSLVKRGNWTSNQSFNIMKNELFYHEQLIDELKILNLEPTHDLFILIEHVEQLTEKWISGCSNEIKHSLLCTDKVELSNLARTIPSRYYEPQSTFLILPSSLNMSVIIDLVPEYNGAIFRRMPETFSYFRIGSRDYVKDIYIPTMFEYIWHQLISTITGKHRSFHSHIVARPESPLHYVRFNLLGFKVYTNFYCKFRSEILRKESAWARFDDV